MVTRTVNEFLFVKPDAEAMELPSRRCTTVQYPQQYNSACTCTVCYHDTTSAILQAIQGSSPSFMSSHNVFPSCCATS